MKNLINDRVRVQIFGREYEMDSGGLTALEVQSLAEFVDQKMREVADTMSIVDTQKIAVLTSINIALDYVQLKEKSTTSSEDLTPQLERIKLILDNALSA